MASTNQSTTHTSNTTDLQTAIRQEGESIFAGMEDSSASVFNKDWWYGRIMDWSMQNEEFKTQMFRFVDVFPYLKSGGEVARHLKEYFAESGGNLPSIFNVGVGVGSLAPSLMAGAIRKNIEQMAKMFITGETPKQALKVLQKSRKNKLSFTVDLLGEATLSEKEAKDYETRYLDLIDDLVDSAKSWSNDPILDHNHLGPIPKVNISVKLTALYSQINEKAWEATSNTLKERLRPIFKKARENFVFVNIDMESYDHKDLTFSVFKEIISEPEFADYPHWGIVVQAYLRDSYQDLEDLVEFAKNRKTPITVRLVKGAYWDYETILADQRRWPVPVYTNKRESDANYERCTRLIIENYDHIHLAIGSHNVRSIAAALTMAERAGLPKNAIEVQMLYGMADPIKRSLIKKSYRLREYATVGELIPGMAYLVRRLLENTSNESFLRSKFAENIPVEELLKDPAADLTPTSNKPRWHKDMFENEALLDWNEKENRDNMKQALKDFERVLGKTYPTIIGKKEITTGDIYERLNPSQKDQVVGRIEMASTSDAEEAVQTAKAKFETWKNTPVEERAQLLEKVADLILRDRFSLMAVEVFESGKTWSEADGDICEAIDFCRYYAQEMRRLHKGHKMGFISGETNHIHYEPRGVSLVIAPWNFPLAILTGMVASSIVTGNTVVMKPAEQSSIIAFRLMELLKVAGLPEGVVNFVPGYGEVVGDYLTSHKDVHLITFTGSKAVGLNIVGKVAQVNASHVKTCIIEMGGKNALIIDSDADLDEAVAGVIYSAFGFQGQKCSACSRVIVLQEIYDRFLERLVEATKSIKVRAATDPEAYLGPVVDQEAFNKIRSMIEAAKSESRLVFEGEVSQDGYFISPTIFADVKPTDSLAQDEIFGPVLAVMKAKDLDEALSIANGTQYALTGGVYSRSPANIERIKKELDVGNLYINRGITGAMVGRHPFGGHKMSGLGSKTGGPDYLVQYLKAKTITENTMRRGFAPEDK